MLRFAKEFPQHTIAAPLAHSTPASMGQLELGMCDGIMTQNIIFQQPEWERELELENFILQGLRERKRERELKLENFILQGL